MSVATELVSSSAAALARLIRTRAVSAVEVVAAHLRRIEELNPRVNAVVQLDAERALAAAAAADAATAGGEALGPLHGVPFTAKDIFETAGVVTAVGVPERAGWIPDRDATVVARMRAAGALLLAKTNCPPWGGGGTTTNDVYGRTNNPYDLERSPGGSSGGEAAAIAAAMSPCGLGSDSGGSLRQPAHFCGIATLKPTAGRVPLTGALDDEGSMGAISDPRTQVGPLARFVEDVVLVLSVIAGPGDLEPDVAPVQLREPGAVRLRGLRAAVHTETAFAKATSETIAATAAAAEALSDAGVVIDTRELPPGGHELTEDYWAMWSGRVGLDEQYRVLRRWDAYRRDMLLFMSRYDVLVGPVFPRPAFRHDEADVRMLADGVSYTTPFSLTGWPAAVVRAGEAAGLPIGVQLVARPWRDEVALAAAAAVEEALGGWVPPPA